MLHSLTHDRIEADGLPKADAEERSMHSLHAETRKEQIQTVLCALSQESQGLRPGEEGSGMSAAVNRNGQQQRPSWRYPNSKRSATDHLDVLEMVESLRNVCEDIRGELQKLNTLLHCSNFQRIPARLKRISANTYQAKHGRRAPENKL